MGRSMWVAGLLSVSLLAGCVSTLRTSQAPEAVRTGVEAVLRNQGYTAISQRLYGGGSHVTAELHRSYPYTERVYRVIQEPSLRPDPSNMNVRVFEERIDPTGAVPVSRSFDAVFKVWVSIPEAGPERQLTVSVTGLPEPRTDKYHAVTWVADEPPSARQLEDALMRGLRETIVN